MLLGGVGRVHRGDSVRGLELVGITTVSAAPQLPHATVTAFCAFRSLAVSFSNASSFTIITLLNQVAAPLRSSAERLANSSSVIGGILPE